MAWKKSLIGAAALAIAAPAMGQNVDPQPGYADLMRQPVPVIEGDITDRPYRVIGHITAGVRKATIFSNAPSHDKVFRELWERGRRLGADAVIKAEYGEAHVTAWSWGAREARGVAVKFLTDAEIAALPATMPAKPPVFDQPITDDEKAAVRAQVRGKLRDPESARFRWLATKGEGNSYCGFVNARNGFGGYTGFAPFYAIASTFKDGTVFASIPGIADADPASANSRAVAAMCRQKGVNLDGPTLDDPPQP